ncbi:PP2C family serine/threonine-protein phosphatase [Rathayibacter sp. VKM Ac-2927]|uniref:PP2C family protein-serine/threonine phosphatase n=1 Tax=Rathayibacter sp. VKM Ac-2927 TaxID=2929478 RepID=UPI001FB21A44|nr:protein phosphatase 2C domain-containing protein [Rathayibacter sp. VKM Ac-2927]MCJ1688146.1 protein phosphatase 2C domain-containing protein [Rathayibacter sp. VKM Ac-2927]
MSRARVATVSESSELGGRAQQQDVVRVGDSAVSAYAVVCDGMGGRPDGARCALLSAQAAEEVVSRAHRRPNSKRLVSYLMALPGNVRGQLLLEAERGRLLPNASTTLAVALIHDGIAWLLSVGDSRCTVVRDHDVLESTTPHNRLAESLRNGETALAESAEREFYAATVTRSMAPESADLLDAGERVAVWAVPVQNGDIVLVTSDGVHEALGLVAMAELAARTVAAGDAAGLASILTRAAVLALPGGDNASAAALVVHGVEAR